MAKLKFLFEFIIVLLVLLIGLAFILRNDAQVSVDFYLAQVDTLPLGAWIVLSFALGGIVGTLVRLPTALGQRVTSKRQEKLLKQRDEQLKRLQGEPAKGN